MIADFSRDLGAVFIINAVVITLSWALWVLWEEVRR